MVTSSINDNAGGEQLAESVEELRQRLETMKRMMELDDDGEVELGRKRKGKCKDSIIDGSFMSFVFLVVLLLIICVSFHAFSNLYHAVLKKLHAREHSEL